MVKLYWDATIVSTADSNCKGTPGLLDRILLQRLGAGEGMRDAGRKSFPKEVSAVSDTSSVRKELSIFETVTTVEMQGLGRSACGQEYSMPQ